MRLLKQSFRLFLAFSLLLFTVFPLYANANAVNDQLNYVALGDSLAAGISSENTQIKGYTDFIKEGIEAQTEYQVNLVNKGVPGFTTVNVLNQLSDSTVQAALAEADFITIDIGANDLIQAVDINHVDPNNPEQLAELMENANAALASIGANLTAILTQIKTINPEASIYVMGYYNAMPYLEGMQDYVILLMQYLNGTISAVVQSAGAAFVPTYAAFEGKYETYLPNPANIHPNEAGYQVIGEIFLAQIIPNLAPVEKPNPEPQTPLTWHFGEGEPDAGLGNEAAIYLDILNADVYLKTDGIWAKIGNLAKPNEESLWLVGEGEPNNEIGVLGDLYVDMINKAVYSKTEQGWILIGNFTEDEPEPETSAVWSYGEGAPNASAGENASYYLDILTVDVYEKSNDTWIKIGNLKNRKDNSPWLVGENEPDSEAGKIGELYVDTKNKTVYFKLETGWVLIGNFAEPEPDPETKPDPDPNEEKNPVDDAGGQQPINDGKEKDNSKDGIKKNDDKPASKSVEKKESAVKGQKLPKTATNNFSYMAIGLVLLLSGVGLTLVRKMRAVRNN